MTYHKHNNKHCSSCKKAMVKYGFTKATKQRWKCKKCNKIELRKRTDVDSRNNNTLSEKWLLGTDTLTKLARTKNVHRTTLSRRFSKNEYGFKTKKLKQLPKKVVLILDGTRVFEKYILLVSYEFLSKQPFGWLFTERENFDSWFTLCKKIDGLYEVEAVVSDGQKGLLKAVKVVFGDIPHQRCVAHIVRLALTKLTKNPHTEAGQELRKLVLRISRITTTSEVKHWTTDFLKWDTKHTKFLFEKSINPLTNRKWYTHKQLRSVRSLLKNALGNMFLFINNAHLPNTTNHVEGGINSPLSELLRRHRGITKTQVERLVSVYLRSRQH